MAGFGHVMKIFIGAGFPRMGFPGYIVCLYVVACDNVYFSLIIMLMFLTYNPILNVACNVYFLAYCYLMMLVFNLTTGIRAMVWLGYARWCFYVHNQIVGCMLGGTRHPSSNFFWYM